MLSRDCDGCSQYRICNERHTKVMKGEKVYCHDGTAHLVDDGSLAQNPDLMELQVELL